jgi:hypothetical protein
MITARDPAAAMWPGSILIDVGSTKYGSPSSRRVGMMFKRLRPSNAAFEAASAASRVVIVLATILDLAARNIDNELGGLVEIAGRWGRLGGMRPDLPGLQFKLHHFWHRKLSFNDYVIAVAFRKPPDFKFGLFGGRKLRDESPFPRVTSAHGGNPDQPPSQGYIIRPMVSHAREYAPWLSRWLPWSRGCL